jgi:hypothetical protein
MSSDAPESAAAPPRRLGRTFWTLNTIEMWERLAFDNLRVMAPFYIMQADDPGGLLAGYLYKHYGEKAVLALKYLATHTPFGQGRGWNGDVSTLEATLGVTRSKAMEKLQEITGLDPVTATGMLWDTYSPHTHVWIPFAVIGVLSAICLWIFGRMARRWSDMNA